MTKCICVLLLAAPLLIAKSFYLYQISQVLVYAVAILGLSVLTGLSGQFSLGHGSFFAVGAYVTGILVEVCSVPYWVAIPVAAMVTFAVGLLFGLPARRLSGAYLALATFGLAIATPQILKLSLIQQWTGGSQGIVIAKARAPFGIPLSQDQWLYIVMLTVSLLMFWAAVRLTDSRAGRAMLSVRDNPVAAEAMGVDVAAYKSLAFGLSAMFTGTAGAMGAILVQFVAPDSFGVSLSIGLLVGLVVGGVGWLPGAFVGGAFVLFAPNVAELFSKSLSGAIYGLILILVALVFPLGLGGLWTSRIRSRGDK